MMIQFNEHTLEMAIIDLLQKEGYTYKNGEQIHKEISDVLLRDDLRLYLKNRYNKDEISILEIEGIISKLTALLDNSIYENNKYTLRLITEGFYINREDSSKPDLFIEPIDFDNVDNNLFKIVNQLEIKGTQRRIPDGIIFVNGLPLVVFEFKSAVKEEATIKDAFTQLTVRYKRDIPDLFKYNALIIISDGVNNKYGTLFTPYEFFYGWRKINSDDKSTDGISSLNTMVKGLLRKDRLLSVIKDFIFFPDSSKKEIKIVCRYPQFFATHKLFNNIKKHSKLNLNGDGKGGTYFGATGSGKSFTMLFLTRMLMRSKYFASPTIILITDRTDLDNQLSQQFSKAKAFIGDDCVINVESRDNLREHLTNRTSGGVFLTTIHKFTEDTRLLSERANIICISDEAHRSQTNLSQQIRYTENGVVRSYGFAKYLHDSLPNATYVGFTGTPIDPTLEVFGDIVDEYTMVESVSDGITRNIVYEGRAAKVFLENKKLEEIEKYYKECAEEGTNEYQIEKSKRAIAKMETILGDSDRLQAIAEDFIKHYENRIEEGSTVEGKAMFVCSNRTIAYNLYKKIIALKPEWAIKSTYNNIKNTEYQMAADNKSIYPKKQLPIETIKLVMTRSKDDEKELFDLLGTDEDRKNLAIHFKNPKSNFKIAIVVDMWITGFDVPCLDTMYIDKPLQQHTLVQTISRVNRVYPGKDKGLIVDYIGIKTNMDLALKRYANGKNSEGSVEPIEQSIVIVKDELDILRRMFRKFDYSKFSNGSPLEQLECLNKGAEFIQSTKEKENFFMGHTKKLKSAFNMCSNSEEISDIEREDIHFFCGVRSIIYKLTKGETPDASQMNNRVSKMIEGAIQSECVEEIIQIGNDKENLDILSEEYMEKLQNLPLPNTKIKLMERLLKTVITDFKKVNKVKGIDFSKRLNTLVDKYNDRLEGFNDVLNEVTNKMVDLLKEINIEKKSFQDLGISYEQKAFYDILKSTAEKFGFDYPENKLLKLSAEIKKIVEDTSKYTDWANRDDIKSKLEMDLTLLLKEYGYPPQTNKKVFKEVFEQAENFKKYND